MGIDVIVPQLLSQTGVVCGFTTRLGGVSLPQWDTLNLGTASGVDPCAVKENSAILADYAGIAPDDVALMKQVHGADIRAVSSGGVHADCDCLVTATAGVLLAVRTADCVPVLLADADGGVVAAVHCGWRSIAGGIIEKVLVYFASEYGVRIETVSAALGPAIGGCCYEIGPDVASHLRPESLARVNGRLHGDLKAEVVSRLISYGVDRSRISVDPSCTVCEPERFFSYRRDGSQSGRMAGFIMIKQSE